MCLGPSLSLSLVSTLDRAWGWSPARTPERVHKAVTLTSREEDSRHDIAAGTGPAHPGRGEAAEARDGEGLSKVICIYYPARRKKRNSYEQSYLFFFFSETLLKHLSVPVGWWPFSAIRGASVPWRSLSFWELKISGTET